MVHDFAVGSNILVEECKKMDTSDSSKPLLHMYQTTRCHIPNTRVFIVTNIRISYLFLF